MKILIILLVSFFAIGAFAQGEVACEAENCDQLAAVPAEFNNPEVTLEQADNAFAMTEEVLGDIGRSIAGEAVEE